MKKILIGIVCAGALGLMIWLGVFYWQNLRGIGPALQQPTGNIVTEVAGSNSPIKIASGFSLSVFAKDLPGARMLIADSQGNLWVSQTGAGVIIRIDIKNGQMTGRETVLSHLRGPHGIAFDPADPTMLYYAEQDKISRVRVGANEKPQKIADLPASGEHVTRTIGFGPDGRLYVAIGSTCNVCNESDSRRAAISSMNKDGSDFHQFAKGLRNSVFFTWSPFDGRMWATEMGRDLLGDDIPPDEINIIENGRNYGWPVCYGKNIHDTKFDRKTGNPCTALAMTPSLIDIPAHSAPLGLAFVTADGWPAEFRNNLFVAYHGSWNRTVPTGYKVVRYRFDSMGNPVGADDFITGWLTSNKGASGRPVDILVQPNGIMYISDDKAGVIYLVMKK